jgi:hypothetical protein
MLVAGVGQGEEFFDLVYDRYLIQRVYLIPISVAGGSVRFPGICSVGCHAKRPL